MSVVDNLFNDNVPITITGGETLNANLVANSWNRTTVADGYWLQTKTVHPFSARDIYLANCIDDVSAKVADIEQQLSTGTIGSLVSMNNVIYNDDNYWEDKPTTIAPSTTSKAAPINTLTYMTLGETSDLATDDISKLNDRTCIIQGNLAANSFNQILLTDSGMFYRSVSGDETRSLTGDKVENYDLLVTDKKFSQILDDSTIDDPGYWFLHKESEGRPVWTNINSLGIYIDNRINPDKVYLGWDDGDPEAIDPETEYPERKFILYPPTPDLNITPNIDPTSQTYTNNSYAWTEEGWAMIPPLMSRSEITELFDGVTLPPYGPEDAGKVLTVNSQGSDVEWAAGGGGGGGGGGYDGSLHDFLSLFTANGAQAHYSNFGPVMRSERSDDGKCYFDYLGTTYYSTEGLNRQWASVGTVTGSMAAYKADDPSVITAITVPNACIFGLSGTKADNGCYVSYPVYVELAPFTFTNDGKNVPRNWDIHFCIKGMGEFWRGSDYITPPAYVDVSIVWATATPSINDNADYWYDTSRTYYITKGDCIASKSDFVRSDWSGPAGWTDGKVNLLSATRRECIIAKEIEFHQSFSAGQVNGPEYKPYLRVCVKGISSDNSLTSGLTMSITGNVLGANTFSNMPLTRFGYSRFIEEFTDDRFMDFAYRYVNNLPTRRLSYTNEGQDNLLGVNATNPTLTNNTHVLGQ